MVLCPAGHRSDETDYCSVCGVPLPAARPVAAPLTPPAPAVGARGARDASAGVAASAASAASAATPAGPLTCPLCGEPRGLPLPRECGVCCYPFAPPEPARWWLLVAIDPALDDEPDAASPCPPAGPVSELAVEHAELTVGRHDAVPRPGLALQDPGASRRHARFVIEAGELQIEDLGSTNGTRHTGAELRPHTPVAVRDGDAVTLGRWTRITVHERPR